MELTFTLDEIHLAARQVLDSNPQKVILFYGELGAGKTTLIKEMARALGVKGATSSPTFSLVNEYNIKDLEQLFHFDMYRLVDQSEALDMGIDEYLDSGNWCFIEWPEKIPNLLPEQHSVIRLEVLADESRRLVLT
ncbi:MAG TPA: tRNA (adenosine(37)-N6)-threonylcarbamoyltransferase complex ATPase subunit type 1 TsaE [Flavobacterium sp.]|jgi:tRNA threonylcarbamoyladenosine biosynthesis protein TsaE|nr:tRNA (adenosine(37)-N6)-threonylcarbamoyltransferase complex ATPase subunit type 1 TsaE [Flavobacterium sp.]